jgi:hypothetical protein
MCTLILLILMLHQGQSLVTSIVIALVAREVDKILIILARRAVAKNREEEELVIPPWERRRV